jgi:hypothetical protein
MKRKRPEHMTDLDFKLEITQRVTRLEIIVYLLAATVWGATLLMLLSGRG